MPGAHAASSVFQGKEHDQSEGDGEKAQLQDWGRPPQKLCSLSSRLCRDKKPAIQPGRLTPRRSALETEQSIRSRSELSQMQMGSPKRGPSGRRPSTAYLRPSPSCKPENSLPGIYDFFFLVIFYFISKLIVNIQLFRK